MFNQSLLLRDSDVLFIHSAESLSGDSAEASSVFCSGFSVLKEIHEKR
jgi:hypothetical protein